MEKSNVKWYAQGLDHRTKIRDVSYILPNGDTLQMTYKPCEKTPFGLEEELTLNVIPNPKKV